MATLNWPSNSFCHAWSASSPRQMQELLNALDDLTDCRLIFAMPNADTGSLLLSSMVDGVVENSSRGFAETPSMGIGTINIGDRQRGRLVTDSVIDCELDAVSISAALQHPHSTEFQVRAGNHDQSAWQWWHQPKDRSSAR